MSTNRDGQRGSMGIITALELQKRNKKRVNVFIDDEFSFSVSLDDAARLRKGQTLSPAEIEALRGDAAVQRAVDSAARLLTTRPRSEHEIRQKLTEKETPPVVIDAAVVRLTQLGYIDDLAFARFWVQERSLHKPLSPQALRYELRQKGIADAIIQELLEAVDPDESAVRAAHSRAARLRGSTRREFRENLSGFLLRRGFQYSVIKAALRQVIENLEAEDPRFFAPDSGEDAADE
ncbi:MAG: RecX family transcriptional regulator [bacterium]|nr:RecX family transcriptional regulator [bacterium]